MESKPEVIIIGGGDSYSKHQDFLRALATQPLRDLPGAPSYTSWKQWLVEALEGDYVVYTPKMPNKENARYDEWEVWFERHLELGTGPVVLIGHSLGAMFLAKYLIEHEPRREVATLLLLAGPCGTYDDGTGNDCGSFGFARADLSRLERRAAHIHILHATDDPIVPFDHAAAYQEALRAATLHTFSDRGHFLGEAFPELLELIRRLC